MLAQTQSDLAHSNERLGAEAAHAAKLEQELTEARRLLEREVRPPFRVGGSGSFDAKARLGCPNGRAWCGRFCAARAQAVVLCCNPLYCVAAQRACCCSTLYCVATCCAIAVLCSARCSRRRSTTERSSRHCGRTRSVRSGGAVAQARPVREHDMTRGIRHGAWHTTRNTARVAHYAQHGARGVQRDTWRTTRHPTRGVQRDRRTRVGLSRGHYRPTCGGWRPVLRTARGVACYLVRIAAGGNFAG